MSHNKQRKSLLVHDPSMTTDGMGFRGMYTGPIDVKSGFPHGSNGQMEYLDNNEVASYIGQWKSGFWHGKGTCRLVNGDTYKGSFAHHQRHGNGDYRWLPSHTPGSQKHRTYRGNFLHNKRQGRGEYIWKVIDKPTGTEVISTYVGDFDDGRREGKGVYDSPALHYNGSWASGNFHGYGELTTYEPTPGNGSTNGDVPKTVKSIYKGYFVQGQKEGKGIETLPGGIVKHDGFWKQGEPVSEDPAFDEIKVHQPKINEPPRSDEPKIDEPEVEEPFFDGPAFDEFPDAGEPTGFSFIEKSDAQLAAPAPTPAPVPVPVPPTVKEEEEVEVIFEEDARQDRAIIDTMDSEPVAPTEPDENSSNKSSSNEKKEGFMQAATSKALRPFVIISSSYLLYTITDGAIRMIVLLHAYNNFFSALEVAIMFTLYELAGVFTNLAAGVMGAKWGIKFTLICGLSLQLFSYGLLFGWNDDWSKNQAIIYVTVSQMFAGIAKDLTKLGGKTVTKLVTPADQETKLFKLVSLITGWKNSLKGVGYFLGSALIQIKYELALAVMMGLVLLAMPWAILGLDKNLGMAKKKNAAWHEVFKLDNHNLNWLSFARLFLFASRDFWFEVPLPFFLRSPSCEGLGETICMVDDDCNRGAVCNSIDGFCQNLNSGGGCGGLGVERVIVGAFLGGYIILYGQVQSWTPQLVTGPLGQTPPNKLTEILWGLVNCLPTLAMWIVMTWSPTFEDYDLEGMTIWLIVVIVTFAIVFAINSSIHSFLVVNYASKDKVAVSVGFYYMSNALGRLFGTIGSGILYTYVGDDFGDAAGTDAAAGLAACFLAGTISSLLAAVITTKIDDSKAGLKCGCLTLVAAQKDETIDDDDGDDEKRAP